METFNKKQREKKKAKRKMEKMEKRQMKKEEESKGGLEIDWSSAPENRTLTQKEREQKAHNEKSSQ